MLPFVNLKNGIKSLMKMFIDIKKKKKSLSINSISLYLSSELHLEDALKKRNVEFRALEEQLRQFDEKVISKISNVCLC